MGKKQVGDIIVGEYLCKSTYGKLREGYRAAGGSRRFAVRVVRRQCESDSTRLKREAAILQRISHENVLQVWDLKKTSSHFYLILEYTASDLSQLMRARGPLLEATAWRVLRQLASGLGAMHQRSVAHEDLQPRNILLGGALDDNPPVVKIANPGLGYTSATCYTAPEVLRGEPCDATADLWSVGVILYELLLGSRPFVGRSRAQLLANIAATGKVGFHGAQVTEDCQELVRSLLIAPASARVAAGPDLEQHIYVRSGPQSGVAAGPKCPRELREVHSRHLSSTFRKSMPVMLPTETLKLHRGVDTMFGVLHPLESRLTSLLWQFSPARAAVSAFAELLRVYRRRSHTFGAVRLTGPHAETGAEGSPRSAANPGGACAAESSLSRGPVTSFFVGQIKSSHLFRLRTAQLFPKVFYSI
jgi:serine/threonine protein kinase